MKRVLKYKQTKVPICTVVVSDFNKKERGVATLSLVGNYGSDFDCTHYDFDLDSEIANEILEFIRDRLPKNIKLEKFATHHYPFSQ